MPKTKPTAKKKKSAAPDNGLKSFSMHAFDKATAPMVAKLQKEEQTHPSFGLVRGAGADPETVARGYLQQALGSPSVPSFTAPRTDRATSEFKTIDTETVPLTGTKVVKFRQTIENIPVYGSLVSVELDEGNNLVSLNSSLGQPAGVKAVASVSPADALKAVQAHPGYRKQLSGIMPHLYYYFDRPASKWRLVYIMEDVPVTLQAQAGKKAPKGYMSPKYMDYIVDAQTAKVIAELPRTPTAASALETAVDDQGNNRQIRILKLTHGRKLLKDTQLNVQTYDFKFHDPDTENTKLPGPGILRPPNWSSSSVSAQANAAAVSEFLRNVVQRINIDNRGGYMNSSINCVVRSESDDGKEWLNAFWDGKQMVYGQRRDGTKLISFAANLDVVGHEMFHGVTDFTSRLEYALQPGALNESYSDIFGVIISNFSNPDARTWNWKLGDGLGENGDPLRDLSNPTKYGQPAHMRQFRKLPNTWEGDWGGVHTNSGIHNKAAYNILTAEDAKGNLVFTPREVAAVFYLALTQQLSRTSQFADSRRAVLASARTLFRNLTTSQQARKIFAIEQGFKRVGIV